MKFAAAHKAASYLMIGFAYLAMIAGGGVSGGIALAGAVGLVGSWWWEPPRIRYERWTWLWTGASLLALAYSVLIAVASGDFLGVGAQFLIWLVVAKAYNRRAARDWQQMYLLAFLMLVAGSVLDAEIVYGACFLGFVIAATWALTLFHLRREMEDNLLVKHAADRASERVEVRRILDSRRIVGARFFAGTGLLSFGVFVASAVIFLALPRVGFGFFLKTRGGVTLAGFTDGVTLGGHGVIKNDDTIVMRVEIAKRYGGLTAPELHWRGVAFDHYERGRWRRSPGAPDTRDLVDYPRPGAERHLIAWRNSRRTADGEEIGGVRQDIWLDPLDADVLFGAGQPRLFELAQVVRHRPRERMKNDELRVEHGGTIHYTVWSELDGPSPDALRAATGPLPRGFGVYLQLPPEITPRTLALARTITRGLTNEYDKAVAIQRWLDANLTYSLKLETPTSEPIDFFLFTRKQGHCEYFASAFAVLARAAGIPVRQVNGFLGGEWNEYEGYVAVRAGDAHSWDEVYFPGQGWVTFDPTPAGRADLLGRGDSGWRARMGRLLDTLRFQWDKWVIEYDLVAQLSLFRDFGHVLRDSARTAKRWLSALLGLWPLLAAVALLLAIVAWRRRRTGPRAGGPAELRRARTEIAQIYDRTLRALAKAGVAREPATTPRELVGRTPVARRELEELTELYYAAHWGGRIEPDAARRARLLADEIRAAVIRAPGR